MAVALVGGSVVGQSGGTTTPVTIEDYVIGSTAEDRMLVVLVHNAKKAETISSVKWNVTEELTLIGEETGDDYHRVSAYRLLNPTATTADIVITFSGNPSEGTYVVAFLVDGVDTDTPTADGTGNTDGNGSQSVSVPNCTADDMAVAIGGAEHNSATYSTDTGTTLSNGHGPGYADTGSAYNTGSGSVTIAFSLSSTWEYAIFGFRIVVGSATSATNVVMNII